MNIDLAAEVRDANIVPSNHAAIVSRWQLRYNRAMQTRWPPHARSITLALIAAIVFQITPTSIDPLPFRVAQISGLEPLGGLGQNSEPAKASSPIPKYTFDINFDYDLHRLDAIEQVHFTNTYTQPISQIVFNVPPTHVRSTFDLRSVNLDQATVQHQLNSTVLTIRLPFDLQPNASIDLMIEFTVHIPALSDAQSFASANLAYTDEATNIGYWYPILAPFRSGHWTVVPWHSIGDPFASDIASYTATITATPGVTIVSSGSMSHQDNMWHTSIDRARTFGMFASPNYTESKYTLGSITYSVFTFQRHNILAVPTLIAMIRAVQLYSALYGAYPYSSLRATEVSGPWSMEFSGLVAIGSTDFDGHDGTSHDRLSRITAHEVSHQWWYNKIGDNQAREPWLDEGFARFNELRFYEVYSPDNAEWWWDSIVEPWTPAAPIDSSIYAFNDHRAYLTDIYNQGAQFLDALRTRIGVNTFNAFIRDLAQRKSFGLLTTDDFLNVLREHTKVNLSSLLRKYFSWRYWQR
jgi:hypothetical protein